MDNHIKVGRLVASRTGTIRLADLERYLDLELGAIGDGSEDLQREKVVAEVKKIQAQAEHWRTRSRRERGELIEVAEVERSLAERAAFLRADLENFFRSQAAAIIDRVAGDHELTGELVDWGIELVEEWLDRYSRPLDMGAAVDVPAGED